MRSGVAKPRGRMLIWRIIRGIAPTAYRMVVHLERAGLIVRIPGEARTIKVLADTGGLPALR